MDNPDQQPALQTTSDEWMLPTEALGRFNPPKDLMWNGAHEPVQQKRYGFRVGTFGLLLQARVVSEVIRPQAISTLPGADPWLLGLISLRGNLVPLFDLALLLDVKNLDEGHGRLALVLDKGANALGLAINDFPQPLSHLQTISQMPQLPTVLQEHVTASYLQNERVWLEFNHESFFDRISSTSAA